MGEIRNAIGTIIKVFTGYGFVRVPGETRDIYFNFGELGKMPDIRSWHGGLQPRQGDRLEFDYAVQGGKCFVIRVHSYVRMPYTVHKGLLSAMWHLDQRVNMFFVEYTISEDGYPPTNISQTHVKRLGVRPIPWTGGWTQDEVEIQYRRTHKGRVDQSSIRLR